MIQLRGLRKADDADPPQFELIYFDLEKKDHKGYVMSTSYATEAEFRKMLAEIGVDEARINQLFADAT